MTHMSDLSLAEAPQSYPIVETGVNLFTFSPAVSLGIKETPAERVDRVQIQPAPGQRQFMVRHSTLGHFCGYVVVDESRWDSMSIQMQRRLRDYVQATTGIQISFAGNNNAIITWCEPTQSKGKLSIPVRLNQTGPDFMLGFSTQGQHHEGFLLDNYRVSVMLHAFATTIRRCLYDDIAFRG